jgi:hypothetical protein
MSSERYEERELVTRGKSREVKEGKVGEMGGKSGMEEEGVE